MCIRDSIKSPVEFVVGAVRIAGSYSTPTMKIRNLVSQAGIMGQTLLQPPSVEGWHEGAEWIDSGALMERVNFVAAELSDVRNPGVYSIVDRLTRENSGALAPDNLVYRCLDLLGPLVVSQETLDILVDYAGRDGVTLGDSKNGGSVEQKVQDLLRLIVSTREYQRV